MTKKPTKSIVWEGGKPMTDTDQERLNHYEKFFAERKSQLLAEGLTEEQADFAMQPARLLYEQLKYDVKKKAT